MAAWRRRIPSRIRRIARALIAAKSGRLVGRKNSFRHACYRISCIEREHATMSAAVIQEIEHILADKRRLARFPKDIEAEFLRQTHSFRTKYIRSAIVPMLFIYNIFLLADYFLVPSTLVLAAFLHFCVVSPVIILIGLLYSRLSTRLWRGVAVASVPVLIVSQIMTVHILNSGSGSEHYQYFAIMVLVFTNVNLRLGFRFAVPTTAVIAAIYLVALLAGPAVPPAKIVGTCSIAAVAYLTLLANQRMDRDMRYAFLRRLHDRLLRENAENRAHKDSLTGIANRHLLERVADEVWQSGDDDVSPVAVIMIDLDHFKAFNDRLGHLAGDECLKRVAQVLSQHVEHGELVARYGGEEFIVVLISTNLPDAVRRAERFRRAITEVAIPHPDTGIGGIVTASFGVMAGPVTRHSLAELIAGADAALYAAKRAGRNTVWPPFLKEKSGVVSALPVGLKAK